MPNDDIPTLATFEQSARILSERESLTVTRSDIKRLAKQLRADWIAEQAWRNPDLDVRNLGIVSDPTPREAFKAISANDVAAARRLGLATA